MFLHLPLYVILVVSLYSVHFALVVSLLDALALVVLVLSSCKGNDKLCQPFFVYE